MNMQPQRTDPSPLFCAVTLGEAVREEHGRQGVLEYVKALAPLLPADLVDRLAYRLNVPVPPVSPPPPPPAPPVPKSAPPDMEKLLQMMRLFEQLRPRSPSGGS